jgi:hypothetical protein
MHGIVAGAFDRDQGASNAKSRSGARPRRPATVEENGGESLSLARVLPAVTLLTIANAYYSHSNIFRGQIGRTKLKNPCFSMIRSRVRHNSQALS